MRSSDDTSSLPFNIGTNASYTTYMIVFIHYDVFVAVGQSSKHSITFVIVNSYMYCAIGCYFYAHGIFCPIKSTVTQKLVYQKFWYTANCVAGENWNSSFPSINLPIGHRQSIIV